MADISLWGWMVGAILFALGAGSGYFLARQIKDRRTVELEQKLESARNELSSYQGEVNRHFLKTSLLLGKLTDNYREVYEHLATGAQKLCAETPDTPKLNLPETGILPPMETDEHAAEYRTEPQPAEPAQAVDASAEEHTGKDTPEDATEHTAGNTNEEQAATTTSADDEKTPEDNTRQPPTAAQFDAAHPPQKKQDDDYPLGVESSVELKPHQTHPSVH